MTETSPAPALGKRFKQFYIAMTDQCNLNCIMCSTTIEKTPVERELSIEKWETIIHNVTRFSVESIGFGGGEPLARAPDLSRLVNIVASKGITVNIVTNATLINEKFLEGVAGHKEKVIFALSLDGLEKENDLIRGKGVFKKIIAAAELLRRHQWPFFFTSVLMPENVCQYVKFLKFLMKKYPEAPIDIQPVISNNEVYFLRSGFNFSKCQLDSLKKVLEFLHKNEKKMKLCRSLKITDRYLDYFTNALIPDNHCLMGTESFNINYRGNLWICGKELDFPLTDYKLEDVLNRPEYLNEMKRVACCKSPCLAGLVIEV